MAGIRVFMLNIKASVYKMQKNTYPFHKVKGSIKIFGKEGLFRIMSNYKNENDFITFQN